jgi:hypothetical protein
MFKEGYGEHNPLRRLKPRQRARYDRLNEDIAKVEDEYRKSQDETEQRQLLLKLGRLLRQKAEQFPDEDFLLPTRFGNTLRAFEVYPRLIYGFEGVEGWNRLLAVMPKEYRDLVDDAKVQTDFWLNLWLISLLLILECVGLAVGLAVYIFASPAAAYDQYADSFLMLLLVPVFIVFAFFASHRARLAAVEWGDMVKASYDTLLPELGKKLGFTSSTTLKQNRELWEAFSRVIVYRHPDDMAELVEHLPEEPSDGSAREDLTGAAQNANRQLGSNESENYELVKKALNLESRRADRLEEELRVKRNKSFWQRLFGQNLY